jgi:DNA-binding Xre family transcriptional regulator
MKSKESRKATKWDRYYEAQMRAPEMRQMVEDELRALRIGATLSRLRQKSGLSQTQLAARAGMSAPNLSRIETRPNHNLTLETIVKLFGAMGYEPEINFRPRRLGLPKKGD